MKFSGNVRNEPVKNHSILVVIWITPGSLKFSWDIRQIAILARVAKFVGILSHVVLRVHASQWLVYFLNLNLKELLKTQFFYVFNAQFQLAGDTAYN